MAIGNNLELGSVYGWNNISCVLFGSSLVGFESIEWKKEQNKEHIYGVGRDPRGIGRGNNKYTGTIEILYDELIKIIDNAPNGSIVDIPPFNLTVIFEATTLQPERKVSLTSIEFLESPFKSSQGDTSIKIALPFIMGQVEYV